MHSHPFLELWSNPTFWSAFCGWFLAQITKMIQFFVKTRKVNLAFLVSTGGLPSAHSSMVSALVTSVMIREGGDSTLFAVALAFAIVVMFDAQSVRRAAGLQAKILNQMIDMAFKEHKFSQHKLAELLGHTRFEVFVGMVLGILTALLVHAIAEH
ncbi:MAG: divergent PAP2 family protein [Lentisphaerae bacterium]|nr:divergent PAP2 family protein [Lentisphaerota bacterium]